MYVDIEDWKNGWYGIAIGLTIGEINDFIGLLQMIREDTDQHLHKSSDFKGNKGVGDIEVYAKDDSKQDNMHVLGKTIAPGTNTTYLGMSSTNIG